MDAGTTIARQCLHAKREESIHKRLAAIYKSRIQIQQDMTLEAARRRERRSTGYDAAMCGGLFDSMSR